MLLSPRRWQSHLTEHHRMCGLHQRKAWTARLRWFPYHMRVHTLILGTGGGKEIRIQEFPAVCLAHPRTNPSNSDMLRLCRDGGIVLGSLRWIWGTRRVTVGSISQPKGSLVWPHYWLYPFTTMSSKNWDVKVYTVTFQSEYSQQCTGFVFIRLSHEPCFLFLVFWGFFVCLFVLWYWDLGLRAYTLSYSTSPPLWRGFLR
jgi:hypothetical protein